MDYFKLLNIFLGCIIVIICADNVTSELSFASYYSDHMVLQQGKANMIWGYADKLDDRVMVRMLQLNDTIMVKTTHVIHDPTIGRNIWKVTIPVGTYNGPVTITANSSENFKQITDVLLGDVWICSGQSNMQFTLSMVFNFSMEIADAINYPDIRLFTAAEKWSNNSEYDLLGIEEQWTLPNNDTVGHANWSYFSAVCWLYGKALNKQLNHPIGLIASTWGGTPIESWSSPEAIDTCSEPEDDTIMSSNEESGRVRGLPIQDYPSRLWNAMIHPLLNLTIYGAIWYQGEANSYAPDRYKCQFPIMIDDWRKKFNEGSDGQTDPTFPFGFVQLAPNRNNSTIVKGFPDIRWHQTCDFGYNPNPQMARTFMAVAMDLPDFQSPYGSVHPRDKQDVVSRLMLSALPVAYNITSKGKFQGPMLSAFFTDIGFFTLRIELDKGETPIQVRSNDGFEICCSLNNQSKCDGTDSKWIPAPLIAHDSTSVTMTYKYGCANQWVMGLRYAWRESPCAFKKCAVYTIENELPMPPFITLGLISTRNKQWIAVDDLN